MIIFINIVTKGDVFYPGGYVRVFCSQTIHVCTKCTDAWFTTPLFYHTRVFSAILSLTHK